MKILLAVDGSPVSLRGAEEVVRLARDMKSEPDLHVVYVHPPIPLDFATRHVGREAVEAYYRDEGEAVLKAPMAVLTAADLMPVRHLHVGPPADVILQLAGELGCDLICLGRHGRGTVADLLLGSVANRVVQRAPMPVLLVA